MPAGYYEYVAAAILLPAQIGRALLLYPSVVIVMTGGEAILVHRLLIVLLVDLAALPILITALGIAGAALSTAGTLLMLQLLLRHDLRNSPAGIR